ncbi:MAG: L-serine ammonia-lyase, iron-sulfur-dependent, subunit alpha [Bacteroidota bacterium]|nr:L-serine ammonia-lyase, iron-sulfur-dependent, subunit alpha [Bacteroidota bacterium]
MKKLPGIFNDVIGPVMRGPSSSHTAASWRIGRLVLDILSEPLKKALIEFDRGGAWAPNFREQGTPMGFDGGLSGLEITDERMKSAASYAHQKDITIEYKVSSIPADHPNTVRLTLFGISGKTVQVIAVSLGGGSFEIRSVNGFPVHLSGDRYGLMVFTVGKPDISDELKGLIPPGIDFYSEIRGEVIKYEFKSAYPFPSELITGLKSHPVISDISVINPIMPVITGREKDMPFTSVSSLLDYARDKDADLGDLGLIYEECMSGRPGEELSDMMKEMINTIHNSIDTGLKGTHYEDRILPQQSHLIRDAEKEGRIMESVVNRIIENVAALMESKSAMEVVVAAPTAGSCGTAGGALKAVSDNLGSSADELVKAYFAAGIVGAYFAQGPGFSAEEHGCQVECGAASGMAAAGIVQLMGGTAKQAIDAASMAIQNMIGMICDPVADRVEVPCLGKNISAAVNAYASAVMSVAGFNAVIPLDQVIQTVSEVGKTMPSCVKCTGKGGLAVTEAAKRIKNRLT